jgi:hypothetical protein
VADLRRTATLLVKINLTSIIVCSILYVISIACKRHAQVYILYFETFQFPRHLSTLSPRISPVHRLDATDPSRNLSYGWSITFPKRVLQRVRSSTTSFMFQYPLVYLRPSVSCLCLLLVVSSLTSLLRVLEGSSTARCQIQLAFLVLVHVGCSFPCLYVIFLYF